MKHFGKLEEPLDSSASQRGRALILLREMLLRGDFKPSERLFEMVLAERLGVSRTPIRLALERLAQEGLLESAGAAGGFVVREFTLRDIWDAIEVRGLLEGAAARLVADRLERSAELDVLWELHDKMQPIAQRYAASPALPASSDDVTRYAELNGAFHTALLDLSKSSMLRFALSRIESIPFAGPTAVVTPQNTLVFSISQDQHRTILEALAVREGARAEMIVREHARFARRLLKAALEHPVTALDALPGAALIQNIQNRFNRQEPVFQNTDLSSGR